MSERATYIESLRDLADFLEARPELPVPSGYFVNYVLPADFTGVARALGTFDKQPRDDYFGVERKFGPITYRVFTDRSAVCKRKVVGTRTIPAEPEKTVEIVEWECADSLLEPK